MKKIKKDLILESWERLTPITTNKFWGLICILTSLKTQTLVTSCTSYEIDIIKLSDTLDRLFYFGSTRITPINKTDEYFIYLSEKWAKQVLLLCSKQSKVSLRDVAIYYYIDTEFDSDVTIETLISRFLTEIKLTEEDILVLFDRAIENGSESITEDSYEKEDLWKSIDINDNPSNRTLSIKKGKSVTINKRASDLTSAPFFQSLYAALENFNCFLITKGYRITDLYPLRENNINNPSSSARKECLQKILFGSPGTGKSYRIKELTAHSSNKITTTFHPDTDYTSFVGCYKPQVEADGKTITYRFTPQAFANAYVKAWKLLLGGEVEISSLDIKDEYRKWLPNNDVNSIDQYISCINSIKHDRYESGFEITDPAVIKSIIIEKYNGDDISKYYKDKRSQLIKYKDFLKYLSGRYESVSEDNNFYLIIEEINRGNCAQIFGDIFQLLDRNEEGYSDYVIDVDKDFTEFLMKELVGLDGYKEQICKLGKIENIGNFSFSKIALPCNLSILATMNTSDQSLFPMDSAFKRRWDWEYVPIKPHEVKDVMIKIGMNKYSWREFITEVNKKIVKAHDSEDKQLGPYFIKAKTEIVDGEKTKYISEEQFVSKVMFYLWYEVFKDEVNNTIFITKKRIEDSDDKKNTPFSFNKLFLVDTDDKKSKIDSVMLEKFLADSLGMKPQQTEEI